MKAACAETERIFQLVRKFIAPGKTEKEIDRFHVKSGQRATTSDGLGRGDLSGGLYRARNSSGSLFSDRPAN